MDFMVEFCENLKDWVEKKVNKLILVSEYYLNGVIVFVFYCCYINCKYLKN